jgi:PUA domain protein
LKKKRKEHYLSKSDIDSIVESARRQWGIDVKRPRALRMIDVEGSSLVINDEFMAVIKDKKKNMDDANIIILPFLASEHSFLALFPSVTVDMGAIKHICNGADIMRPGIVRMDEFSKGSVVTVKDEKYAKYIAVGIALVSSSEAKEMSKGAVIQNMHYVGDEVWQAYKSIL